MSAPSSCVPATSSRARISDRDRHRERIEWPVRVLTQVVLSLGSPDDACSNADVRKEIALHRGGYLFQLWQVQLGAK
jgi:hypothetical protein